MTPGRQFTQQEAKRIGDQLEINWGKIDIEEFRMGLAVELEHGLRDPVTNVTGDGEILTGKIAWAHLNEFPDYYTRLEKLEQEADEYWAQKGK